MFLFVLSKHFRCRTKSGPHTVGRRFCAVQAFCRRQNLGAGAIHLPRAFEISQDSIKITTPNGVVIFMEVTPGFEPGNQGFADPCLTTWLCHHLGHLYYMQTFRKSLHLFFELRCPHSRVGIASGAGNEARTRYLHLGKVALYQMSYARKWCPEPESNQRHEDFQSSALPTELSGQVSQEANASWEMATRNGLEPSTSSVTG